MHKMEHSKEYQSLYNQYKNKSDKKLQEIAQSGEEYREIAKQVARDILNSDRTEYFSQLKEQEEKQLLRQERIKNTENHPLYNEIHQIAGDLRFLKKVVIVLIILYVLGVLFIAFNLL